MPLAPLTILSRNALQTGFGVRLWRKITPTSRSAIGSAIASASSEMTLRALRAGDFTSALYSAALIALAASLLMIRWALDADGQPTTDAKAALAGSMLPAGGQKGFGAGLMAEILAAALAGANLSTEASPFSGNDGGPPGTGQFFIGFDPQAFSGDGFNTAMSRLARSITDQDGARLPGARRALNRARTETGGVRVDQALLDRIEAA